jgi:hypothetical protein
MALVAKPRAQDSQEGFYAAKLHTARFFMEHLLPQADALAASVRAGSASLMQLRDEDFAF